MYVPAARELAAPGVLTKLLVIHACDFGFGSLSIDTDCDFRVILQSLFWSGAYILSQKYSECGRRVYGLADKLTGYLVKRSIYTAPF